MTKGRRVSSTTAKRTALVVTGMHRSGTSALTRILHLACGADLPTDLMPPRPDNVAGFWEPLGTELDEYQAYYPEVGGLPFLPAHCPELPFPVLAFG